VFYRRVRRADHPAFRGGRFQFGAHAFGEPALNGDFFAWLGGPARPKISANLPVHTHAVLDDEQGSRQTPGACRRATRTARSPPDEEPIAIVSRALTPVGCRDRTIQGSSFLGPRALESGSPVSAVTCIGAKQAVYWRRLATGVAKKHASRL